MHTCRGTCVPPALAWVRLWALPLMRWCRERCLRWSSTCSVSFFPIMFAISTDLQAGAHMVEIPLLAGDAFVSSGLVNQGYFPCSADFPTVVLTTRVLELYRVTRLRCPRLAIQPFVRSLCDIHGARRDLLLRHPFLLFASRSPSDHTSQRNFRLRSTSTLPR